MSLTDKVHALYGQTKELLGAKSTQEDFTQQLKNDKELSSYFKTTSSQEYNTALEESVNRSFAKYQNQLNSAIARVGKSAGATGSAAYLFSSFNLTDSVGMYFANGLILGKTALELPKLYGFLKNTKDMQGVYGLAQYGLRKAAGLILPWVGPVIEGGAFKDMVRTRVLHEAKKDFLKTIGSYKPLTERVHERVEHVAGPIEKYARAA